METQIKTSGGVKNFFINLGAIVALGVIIGHLINLLFTVIDKAYPLINGYNYYGSYSISWPVATLIVSFPIYILLMWLLEREYVKEPDRRYVGVRRWLTYLALFVAGLAIAGDLITVLYYFIDGQEITTGFLMKALSVLVISLAVFFYYISDVLGKLNSVSRKVWAIVALIIVLGSIILGFAVFGSPRTQQLLRYDEQKVNNLRMLDDQIKSYVQTNKSLPDKLTDISSYNTQFQIDQQTQKQYEYEKISDTTYNLCAEFNKRSGGDPYISDRYDHPAGRFCFKKVIDLKNPYSNKDSVNQVIGDIYYKK